METETVDHPKWEPQLSGRELFGIRLLILHYKFQFSKFIKSSIFRIFFPKTSKNHPKLYTKLPNGGVPRLTLKLNNFVFQHAFYCHVTNCSLRAIFIKLRWTKKKQIYDIGFVSHYSLEWGMMPGWINFKYQEIASYMEPEAIDSQLYILETCTDFWVLK